MDVAVLRYVYLQRQVTGSQLEFGRPMLNYSAVEQSSLVAQRLKPLPAMQETRVWSLGREDPLEKEIVTHSSILAWRIPWMEKPGRLQSTGSQRVGHDWAASLTYLLRAIAVVMYGCESWTVKKPECQRINAFELWCWRRLPWTERRSNQSILKEINPDYSLERLMLKLKLQYFGHLMRRADSLEKTLMLGRIEDRRRRGWQRMRWYHWLNEHEFEQAPGDGEGQGSLASCSPWGCKE